MDESNYKKPEGVSNMNQHENTSLDDLLQGPLNEEVFDRILEVLEHRQHAGLEDHKRTTLGFAV